MIHLWWWLVITDKMFASSTTKEGKDGTARLENSILILNRNLWTKTWLAILFLETDGAVEMAVLHLELVKLEHTVLGKRKNKTKTAAICTASESLRDESDENHGLVDMAMSYFISRTSCNRRCHQSYRSQCKPYLESWRNSSDKTIEQEDRHAVSNGIMIFFYKARFAVKHFGVFSAVIGQSCNMTSTLDDPKKPQLN